MARSERPATATKLSLPPRVGKLPSTFFEWPPSRKPGYVTTHSRLGDLHATLLRKSLAMLPEGQVGIPLQVPGQPLPQCLALHGGPTGDLVDVDVSRLAPPF